MLVFMSYSSLDRSAAAKICKFFDGLKIPKFMAHEDINVSREWQEEILSQISQADIFVAILSVNYLASPYCIQEAGIAIYRKKEMTIIPLSIDGTVSPGMMAHIQSRRVNPESVDDATLFAGLVKYNAHFAIDHMVDRLRISSNYRSAERHFALLLPYLENATDEQIVEVLKAAVNNGQISEAGLCARTYLPPLFKTHGKFLNGADQKHLGQILDRYAPP